MGTMNVPATLLTPCCDCQTQPDGRVAATLLQGYSFRRRANDSDFLQCVCAGVCGMASESFSAAAHVPGEFILTYHARGAPYGCGRSDRHLVRRLRKERDDLIVGEND